MLEELEVEGLHLPAGAEVHLHEALALQAEQRLAHRRARHPQTRGDLALGETVARHQTELGDVVLDAIVDRIGEGGMQRRSLITGAHACAPSVAAGPLSQPSG